MGLRDQRFNKRFQKDSEGAGNKSVIRVDQGKRSGRGRRIVVASCRVSASGLFRKTTEERGVKAHGKLFIREILLLYLTSSFMEYSNREMSHFLQAA